MGHISSHKVLIIFVQIISTEAIQVGEVRGYLVSESDIKDVPYNEELKGFMGNGFFRVSKILYGLHKPLTSAVPLVEGDITSEFEYFMEKSDQIPSAVSLETQVDENEKLTFSGGIVVQTMPDAPHELLPKVKELISQHSIADLCIFYLNSTLWCGNVKASLDPHRYER